MSPPSTPNGQSDQKDFNLVSLEGSNNKSAFSAYTSYKQQSSEGGGSGKLDFNEEEGTSAAVVEQPPKKPPSKKPTTPVEDETEEKKTTPPKKKPKIPPPNPEIKAEQTVDDILDKLAEFQSSLTRLVNNFSQMSKNVSLSALAPFLPLANKLLKMLNGPIQMINKITSRLNERMGVRSSGTASANGDNSESISENEEKQKPKAPPAKIAFSDMLELNIIFTDNMKKPLYTMNQTRGTGKLGSMEEDLVMGTAMSAIKECAEFTVDLPTPTTGSYQGTPIFDIMSNITEDDVKIFLRFVKAYPGKYIGKEWKISETFATWLINNAPTPDD